jgi:hypothetical protein
MDKKSRKPNAPKRAVPNRGKPRGPGKPGDKGGKPPAWWVFTHRSSAFAKSARALSEYLIRNFGEGVSISHFERMLGEWPSLSDEQRSLIHLEPELLELYESYLSCRTTRDAERDSIRSLKSVSTVEGALAYVKESLEESKED